MLDKEDCVKEGKKRIIGKQGDRSKVEDEEGREERKTFRSRGKSKSRNLRGRRARGRGRGRRY